MFNKCQLLRSFCHTRSVSTPSFILRKIFPACDHLNLEEKIFATLRFCRNRDQIGKKTFADRQSDVSNICVLGVSLTLKCFQIAKFKSKLCNYSYWLCHGILFSWFWLFVSICVFYRFHHFQNKSNNYFSSTMLFFLNQEPSKKNKWR